MSFAIFSTAAQQIVAHAAGEAPREACGLLLGQGERVEQAIPAANVADDPLTAFEIDPALLLRAHREARDGGLAILGWYHSHPNGRRDPSAEDAARAEEAGKLWLIVADGALHAYLATGGGAGFTRAALNILPPGAAG